MTWEKEANKKIIEPQNLVAWSEKIKKNHQTLATLNGSFDLLHAGHLYMIYEASKQADVLLVALNSDQSVKKYKSPTRPIIPLKYRMQMMAALEFVGYVTWFDETDPRELLRKVRPHVHVNGKEYGQNCIESEVVKEIGAKLYLVDRIEGLSSTEVIQRIKTCV